jgi:RNA polymerase sigma-70 factor (ECF subfamily)
VTNRSVPDISAEEAFRSYVVPEVEVLLRVARSITRHDADAEDLVQDTLIRAYRAIDRFDGAYPRAWLLTIMRNTQRNRVRKRRPVLLIEGGDGRDQLANVGGGTEPEVMFDATLLEANLQAAVDALPESFRAAVELVDLSGLTYEEAAAVLEAPVGTIMSRLHRGRARLRQQLGPRHEGSPQ